MEITKDIKYVGVNDRKIDLFEGQYKVPSGMAYNSYVILDEKIAVFDTVDAAFTHEWLDNLANVLGDRRPDYLIVHNYIIRQFMIDKMDQVSKVQCHIRELSISGVLRSVKHFIHKQILAIINHILL